MRSPFILPTDHRRGRPNEDIVRHRCFTRHDQEYCRYWESNEKGQGGYLPLIANNDQARLQQCLPVIGWVYGEAIVRRMAYLAGYQNRPGVAALIVRYGQRSFAFNIFFSPLWGDIITGALKGHHKGLYNWARGRDIDAPIGYHEITTKTADPNMLATILASLAEMVGSTRQSS